MVAPVSPSGSRSRGLRPWTAVAAAAALAAGCAKPPPPLAASKPPEVVVDLPVTEDVTDYEDFTGRTEAVASVDVRSRVTGYLDKLDFKDGADVKKEDVLFRIDPRPYQAEFDRTDALLRQAEKSLAQLQRDYDRAEQLKKTGGAISAQEYDKAVGDRDVADAAVGVARAAREVAKLNLDYTTVTAPLTGQISRRMVDPGNLVKADDTILTSIVALDTIYVNFDVDDRTLLRIRRLIRDGKVTSARARDTWVQVGLPDEEGYSLTGVIRFSDNKVDPGTGTLRIRADIDNLSVHGRRLLSPGMFVRVRLPVGTPKRAVLVPEEAVATDQGQKYVYLVNDADEVVYRKVKLGSQYGQYRVIEDGLAGAERVIVSGVQRVRQGVKVTPKAADRARGPVVPTPAPAPIAAPGDAKPPAKAPAKPPAAPPAGA